MESDTSMPWMDKEWTQKILRDVEDDPSLTITDYCVTNASVKGEHFLSDIDRITVRLKRSENDERKISLFAKKIPSGKQLQAKISEASAFPNEIKIFSQVLPKYQAILESVGPGRYEPFSARYFCSKNDFPFFLVVSDLSAEGYKMGKRQVGLDLDHCLLVAKVLGRYHAASVALHKRSPKFIESFKGNMFTEENSCEMFQSILDYNLNALARAARLWPSGDNKVADKLLKLVGTFSAEIRKQLSPKDNRLNVLTHGDLWTNNLLFRYNDVTGRLEDVKLVDFQMASYASCAIDLQYFIHLGASEEVRLAHEEDILKEYHNELCSTLVLLGQAEKAINYQELVEEYERKRTYGLIFAIAFLPGITSESEDSTDIEEFLSMINNQSESSDNEENERFLKIFKVLLPMLEKKGDI